MIGNEPFFAALILCPLRRRSAIGLESGKTLPRHLDQFVMTQAAGCRHHHVIADIVAVHVFSDGVGREVTDGIDRAQDGAANGLGREGGRLKQVEDMIIGVIAGRADLLHDDLLFTGQLVLFEQGILQYVRQNVGRKHHVVLEHPGEITGVLDRSRGIEIAAYILDGFGDLQRVARGGALEGHVFEQVGNAVFGLPLAAGTRLDPNAEGSTFEMWHVVGENHHAVVQGRRLYAHASSSSRPGGRATAPASRMRQAARVRAEMNSSTAAWSLARTLRRSSRACRSANHAGSAGWMPLAASTAAGNFAGWAVARVTMGVGPRWSRATLTPTAVCGSSR